MTEEDWAIIQDLDGETWRALPEATRRAIQTLRGSREEHEAALRQLREGGDEPG